MQSQRTNSVSPVSIQDLHSFTQQILLSALTVPGTVLDAKGTAQCGLTACPGRQASSQASSPCHRFFAATMTISRFSPG